MVKNLSGRRRWNYANAVFPFFRNHILLLLLVFTHLSRSAVTRPKTESTRQGISKPPFDAEAETATAIGIDTPVHPVLDQIAPSKSLFSRANRAKAVTKKARRKAGNRLSRKSPAHRAVELRGEAIQRYGLRKLSSLADQYREILATIASASPLLPEDKRKQMTDEQRAQLEKDASGIWNEMHDRRIKTAAAHMENVSSASKAGTISDGEEVELMDKVNSKYWPELLSTWTV